MSPHPNHNQPGDRRSATKGTTTTMTLTETSPSSRNGVDTAMLFATLDAVKQAPAAAQSRSRSAVYDVITNGVPVTIDVDVA